MRLPISPPVPHSNLGLIAYRFKDIAGFCAHYPTPIPPLHQIAHVGVSLSRYLKLLGREIIFEVFQTV